MKLKRGTIVTFVARDSTITLRDPLCQRTGELKTVDKLSFLKMKLIKQINIIRGRILVRATIGIELYIIQLSKERTSRSISVTNARPRIVKLRPIILKLLDISVNPIILCKNTANKFLEKRIIDVLRTGLSSSDRCSVATHMD